MEILIAALVAALCGSTWLIYRLVAALQVQK